MKQFAIGLLIVMISAVPALSACPSSVPNSTPEAIAENGQRLVCLQNELAAETARRTYQFELQALENKIQDIQLQQRLNDLPHPYVPLPVFK